MAEDLVDKVINFFSGDSEKMSDKEVILKQRLKELGENKYVKFYRLKTDEADPSLAQFFYSLYKMILPVRTFMKDTAKITRLRQLVLEAYLDASIVDLIKRLRPSEIEERSKNTPPKELTAEIRADIEALTEKFDSGRINGVNRCHNLVMVVFQFVMFDYPALLKYFDQNFTEGPFGGDAKFSQVKASVIAKSVGEFLAVSQNINPDSDWKTLIKLLRLCAGEELVSDNQFAQLLLGLRDIVNSKVLELIVQCGSMNPIWTCKPRIPDEHIAEAWLESKIDKAQECIDKINTGEKNKQISALLKEIFYGGDLQRLDYYTVARNDSLRKKELAEFAYAEGLNYLSVFLSEYVEKDIHELCDILLIRGQWTNNSFSKEMSEAFHQMLAMPSVISQLDETLSDEGSNGSRLKAALLRVDRDRTQARYIESIINDVDDSALELLNTAVGHLTVIDKHLKNLGDDVQKKHPELIINWRELNSVSKVPLLQQMAENHGRLSSFIQLLQLCMQ
ncbi:MAG: DUF5312 family protein [Oscillospiraceae bacterium]|nr:DUF5312 family protein [Oscillospiraceae bacterium]